MSKRIISLSVTSLLLCGCFTTASLKTPRPYLPQTKLEAATVSVSALPAVQFNLVRSRLKPNDPAKSSSEYRATSIERTLSVLERNRSSSGAGLTANLLGVEKSKVTTETRRDVENVPDVDDSYDKTITSTRTVGSGARPDASVSAAELSAYAAAISGFSPSLDQELVFEAADYLYQRAKLNDSFYDLELGYGNGNKVYDPWVLKLNVTVQPNYREMPYDVKATLRFSGADGIRLVPLFATGNYESSDYSKAVSQLAQISANLSAVTGGTGLGAGIEKRIERLLEQVGTDINTKISVGINNDSELRLSLPAAFLPKADKKRVGYELREQNYSVTVLAYVPRDCATAEGTLETLTVNTDWDLYDIQHGGKLPEIAMAKHTASTNINSTHTVKIPLPYREAKLPDRQLVSFIDDGKDKITVSVPGASYLPEEEFEALLYTEATDPNTEAADPNVAANQENSIDPKDYCDLSTIKTGGLSDSKAASAIRQKIRKKESEFDQLMDCEKCSEPNSQLLLELKSEIKSLKNDLEEQRKSDYARYENSLSRLSYPIYATKVGLSSDVFSAQFPSVAALGRKGEKPIFIKLQSTKKQKNICGNFKEQCYPLVLNKAKSGKVPKVAFPYETALVSAELALSKGGDDTPKIVKALLYVNSKKGVDSPPTYFKVQVKGGTILPQKNDGVVYLSGDDIARPADGKGAKMFFMKTDTMVEVSMRDVASEDSIEFTVIPWDEATNKAVTPQFTSTLKAKVK